MSAGAVYNFFFQTRPRCFFSGPHIFSEFQNSTNARLSHISRARCPATPPRIRLHLPLAHAAGALPKQPRRKASDEARQKGSISASTRAAASRCGGAAHSSPSDERQLENLVESPAPTAAAFARCLPRHFSPTIGPVAVLRMTAQRRSILGWSREFENLFRLLLRYPLPHCEQKPPERDVHARGAALLRH